MDLALNNLQRLICHKTQITNQFKQLLNANNLHIYIVLIFNQIYLNFKSNTNNICRFGPEWIWE